MGLIVAPASAFSADNRAATPSATETTVALSYTTSVTPNADSAWVDLFAAASITADVHLLTIGFLQLASNGVDTAATFDIAIGAAGSEVILFSVGPCGWSFAGTTLMNHHPSRTFDFPILIKSGTRIAFRARSVQASKVINVVAAVKGWDIRPAWCFSGIDFIGFNSATQKGTSVTAGSSNANGSWTNIGSALARDYDGVFPLLHGLVSGTSMTLLGYHFEVGFGSRKLQGLDEWRFNTHNTEYVIGPRPVSFHYQRLPAGTQMQMRGICSGAAQALDAGLALGWF